MNDKIVRVILSPEAEEAYRTLNSRAADSKLDRSILKAINKKTELIKADLLRRSNFKRQNPD